MSETTTVQPKSRTGRGRVADNTPNKVFTPKYERQGNDVNVRVSFNDELGVRQEGYFTFQVENGILTSREA